MAAKIKIAICGNEIPDDEHGWVSACESRSDKVAYHRINLTASNWLEQVKNVKADWYVLKPSFFTSHFKTLYDERILIMEEELGLRVFPRRKEVFVYENKRFLSFFLMANGIPHPKTVVYYNEKEALEKTASMSFPVVGKTNIGASGSGVSILKTANEAQEYIQAVFSGKGAVKKVGPNKQKPKLIQRGLKMLMNPAKLKKRLRAYKELIQDKQTNFVIFQNFTPHNHEWRAVRIGDSFFAHKKLKLGEKASGSLLKNYDNPPLELMDFLKELTDKLNFKSQAVDIFETPEGYLVNEMQCIFGQSDKYQMLVDGKIGRYIHNDGSWVFEEGDFAHNQCYDLRLDYLLEHE